LSSSQEDSHVRTSQLLEKEQELKDQGLVFGQRCTALLGRYDPGSHSLKMSQCSLFGEEHELLLILPKSAMMRNGRLWAQTMWVRGTEEKEFGYVPTPDTQNHRDGKNLRKDTNIKEGGMHGVSLHHYITMFPTPTGQEIEHPNVELTETGRRKTKDGKDSHSLNLADTVKTFPTPTSRDWKDTEENVNWEKVAKKSKLAGRVMLPTPTAAEANKIPAKANYGQIGLNNHPLLRGYPTRPKATKSRKGEKMVFPTPRANLLPGLITKTSATRNKGNLEEVVAKRENLTSGQLNPTWVEWLMGYPTGWTDLKDLETQ